MCKNRALFQRLRIQLAAYALHLRHDPQSIFTENFLYVTLGIAFFQQRFGDVRQLCGVFHAIRHVGAVEVRTEADVVDARDFHGVIDVLDDFRPIHAGQFTLLDVLTGNAVTFDKPAAFVLTAALHLLGSDGLVELGIGFFGVAEFLTQKADVIIDLDDAALRRQVLHHLIGHVARRITNRAAGGVRSDQRGFARFERVVKGLVADVGDVHYHAEAVHFADDLLAEIGETVVYGLVCRRVGPFVIAAVRERHVADTESGIGAQNSEVAIDHVAAFDAHERGDLALFVCFADFGGGGGKREVIGMLADLFAHSIDLDERTNDGVKAGYLARNPDGEKDRAEISFAHARDVDTAGSAACAEVELSIEETLRCVVMRVHDDGGKMQLASLFGDRIGGHRKTHQADRRDAYSSEQQSAKHACPPEE